MDKLITNFYNTFIANNSQDHLSPSNLLKPKEVGKKSKEQKKVGALES